MRDQYVEVLIKEKSFCDKYFSIYFTILLFLIVVYRFYLSANNRLDDAFITYRVAYNLYEHGQLVYNLGEFNLVTTSPLQTILLAPFFYFVPFEDIPLLANILSAIFILFSAALLYYFFKINNQKIIAVSLPILMVSLNYPYFFLGLETNFFIFLLILSTYMYCKRLYFYSGIFCGLTFLARGDGIILSIILLISIINKIEITQFVKGLSLIIIPWEFFSKFYFGSFFPSTLQTKVIQGESRMFGPNFKDTIFSGDIANSLVNNKFIEIILLLISIMVLFYLIKKFFSGKINDVDYFLLILILFGILQTLGYIFLNVAGNYPWYKAPIMLSIILSLIYSINVSTNIIKYVLIKFNFHENLISVLTLAFALLFCIILIFMFNNTTSYSPPWTGNLGDNYLKASNYLQDISDKKDTIGLGETGIMGFYLKDRKIFDYFGVVTPWVLKIERNNWYNSISIATLEVKPKYIVFKVPIYESLLTNYSLVKTFETSNNGWIVGVYKLNS